MSVADGDWNNIAETIVAKSLSSVPTVGGLLSGIVTVLWPVDKPNPWAQIKAQAEAAIKQAISNDQFQRVTAKLGTQAQNSGLIGVLNEWLDTVNGTSTSDPRQVWQAAQIQFVASLGEFQQAGIEQLLLPLFAQFGNLHLALLKDGVLKGFTQSSALQKRIVSYIAWANRWMGESAGSAIAQSPDWNVHNDFARFIQLAVGNHKHLWTYFDPTMYPQSVTIPLGPPIYYSATGLANGSSGKNLPSPVRQYQNVTKPVPDAMPSAISFQMMKRTYTVSHARMTPGMEGQFKADFEGFADRKMMWTGSDGVTFSNDHPAPPANPNLDREPHLVSKDKNTWWNGEQLYPWIPVVSVSAVLGLIPQSGQEYLQLRSQNTFVRSVGFTLQDQEQLSFLQDDFYQPQNFCAVSITPGGTYSLSTLAFANTAVPLTDIVWGFRNFTLVAPPTQSVGFDPSNWAQKVPLKVPTGSTTQWVVGYSVQYTVQWVYADGTQSNIIGWGSAITGPWALPTLLVPISSEANVVGRRIWRWFRGSYPSMIATINDNTTTRYLDQDQALNQTFT